MNVGTEHCVWIKRRLRHYIRSRWCFSWPQCRALVEVFYDGQTDKSIEPESKRALPWLCSMTPESMLQFLLLWPGLNAKGKV